MTTAARGSADRLTPVHVSVPSEYHRLETVVMCLANPWTRTRELPDLPLVRQMLRNPIAPYDHGRVREEQQEFARLMTQRGVTVLWAEPLGGIVTQHYTRDVAFAVDDVLVVARPRRAARQRELPGLRRLLPRVSKVVWLDAGTIEGGDVLVDTDHVVVGLGEETDPAGVEALRYRLAAEGVTKPVVVLTLAHGGAIHIDTLFTIVAPGVAIVHRPSFTRASLRWIEDHYDLIDVDDRQRRRLAVNTLSLDPSTVAVRAGDDRLAESLTDKGLTVVPVTYDEVTRLPGSLRCTTMPIRRTPASGTPTDARHPG